MVTICFLLTPVMSYVAWSSQAEDMELGTAQPQVHSAKQGETPPTDPDAPPGALWVKEVRVNGNTLISTAELLKTMPEEYIENDFRVLREIILSPGQKRPVSLQSIRGLTKYILSKYNDKGYAGIYVYVPADTVERTARLKNDILMIEVLEGRVAEIMVERYDLHDPNQTLQAPEEEVLDPEQKRGYLKSSVLKSWSPVKEGEVIKRQELDDFVGQLNLNPDRYVRHYVSRSRDPNALKLSFDVYEASPWHWYIQADDSGTKQRQWAPRTGVVNTNFTGIDDRLSVQYQAPWERGLEEEYSVFGMYDLPLITPRLRLGMYGGYSEFDISTEGIGFLGNGSLFGSTLSFNLMQLGDWFLDLTGSVSRERSKVTPSLGIASDVDMDLWGGGISLHHRAERDMSNTTVSVERTESIGGSSQNAFDDARLGAERDFAINSISVAHARYLDPKKVHRIRASLRMVEPEDRLVPAKMTVFGGLYTVKGYEEDEIVADGGVLFSAQYEFDLAQLDWSRGESSVRAEAGDRNEPWLRKLAPLVFFDMGRAQIEDPLPGEQRIQELASVGAGAIVDIQGGFTGALYYGWPLRSTLDTDEGRGKLNASLTYRF